MRSLLSFLQKLSGGSVSRCCLLILFCVRVLQHTLLRFPVPINEEFLPLILLLVVISLVIF